MMGQAENLVHNELTVVSICHFRNAIYIYAKILELYLRTFTYFTCVFTAHCSAVIHTDIP